VVEERERLARELHDSVVQALYSIRMYAGAAARLLDTDEPRQATEQLREIGAIS
jgi:signal transduction histidine kinase